MKKFSHLGVILVMTGILSLAACNQPYGAAPAMTTTPIESATAPSDTPFISVQFSPTADKFTSTITVNVLSLSGTVYVHAKTNVKIADSSNDNRANACHILKQGFDQPVSLPTGSGYASFSLPAGSYTLTCENPSVSMKIESQ